MTPLFSLGDLALTGHFPTEPSSTPTAPLSVALCEACSLVQLEHSVDASLLYGAGYGYRSSLNSSMARHLLTKAERLSASYSPTSALDIGSNDGTFLAALSKMGIRELTGVDPILAVDGLTAKYPPGASLHAKLFDESLVQSFTAQRFDLVTTIAMFYDLDNPVAFARAVADVLAEDGVWHLEQSYLPSMLSQLAYDTICHEHLEYYSLTALKFILDQADLKIVRFCLNDVNGGSFECDVAHRASSRFDEDPAVAGYLEMETLYGLRRVDVYLQFEKRMFQHREGLLCLLEALSKTTRIGALGASTKGNVLLQWCGLHRFVDAIGEVNSDKFGAYTPGTGIPIRDEADMINQDFGALLILPWHFRSSFLRLLQDYRSSGGRLIFPLPNVEIL